MLDESRIILGPATVDVSFTKLKYKPITETKQKEENENCGKGQQTL